MTTRPRYSLDADGGCLSPFESQRLQRENSGNYYRLKDAKPKDLLKAMPAARSTRKEVNRFDLGSSRSIMLFLTALFAAAWIYGRRRGLP